MSEASKAPGREKHSLASWFRREQILDAFESAWELGEQPQLDDYLPADDADRLAVLADLVQVDLECRLKAGAASSVETYLERFPELASDAQAVVKLITWEYQLRLPREKDLTLGDYQRRFPQYAERLRQYVAAPPTTPSEGNPPQMRAVDDGLIPGYEILDELGRGGMGVVYKARHLGLNRLVALKMVLAGAHAGPEELLRFLSEAEAVARLRHPHIVQVHHVGHQEQRPYFTMEFVEGGSLARKLAGTPQPARQAAALVEMLARAMHVAHQSGIIHRDLKPANVLLTADGTPKITDFGLAKRLEGGAGLTQSGVVVGTPSYMAPEQARGKAREIGPATDIYALGAILYEMLTGRPPFRAETAVETVLQVIADEPVPPSRLNPKVPRDLETIGLKCLQKDQKKRYGTALALADDLRRLLSGEPIHARPTPGWERLALWARRKPAAALLVGVSTLAAFLVVASIALYARFESQQAAHYKHALDARERISQTLRRAQDHEAGANWNAANTELEKAQLALDAQSELLADDLRDEVRHRLAVVRQKLQQQDQRQQAKKRLEDFHVQYHDALFYDIQLTGLDIAQNRAKTETAARSALGIYGLDGEAGAAEGTAPLLQRDRPYHQPDQHTRLAGACYELLLIWAQTETDKMPAGRPGAEGQGRHRAEKALVLLARAARLGQVYGLQTRTYHLLQARCLAQSKGELFDAAAAEKAAPGQAVGRLDCFLTGLDLYRHNQFAESIVAWEQVLQEHGDDFWLHYAKALAQMKLGQWVSAKAELTVCLNLKRDFVWLRLLRGFAASEVGFKHAEKQLATAEFRAAEMDFDTALKLDPDPVVQYAGLVNRGVLNIRRQRWEEALRDLREAVKVKPERYEGYLNLAQAYRGMKNWAEAEAALDQAVKQAPHLPVVYESRAKLHLVRKHWAAARADFEQAIARAAKDSSSDRLVDNLVELGRLLHREGKYPAALASYDRALALRPDFVLAQRFRAETLLALNRFAEAGQSLDHYLAATTPAPAAVYQARGLIYAQTGQLPAAIEMYTLALRHQPDDTLTRCQRGWTYLLTDAVGLGLEDFKTCLRLDETNLDALIGQGNARIRLKQLDAALEDAEAAEQLAAQKTSQLTDRLLYNLARIYAQAAGQLAAEPRTGKPGLDQLAAQRLTLFKTKALDYLGQTLEKLPQERQAAFWRDQVHSDPAFFAIRGGNLYLKLAARYAAKAP